MSAYADIGNEIENAHVAGTERVKLYWKKFVWTNVLTRLLRHCFQCKPLKRDLLPKLATFDSWNQTVSSRRKLMYHKGPFSLTVDGSYLFSWPRLFGYRYVKAVLVFSYFHFCSTLKDTFYLSPEFSFAYDQKVFQNFLYCMCKI